MSFYFHPRSTTATMIAILCLVFSGNLQHGVLATVDVCSYICSYKLELDYADYLDCTTACENIVDTIYYDQEDSDDYLFPVQVEDPASNRFTGDESYLDEQPEFQHLLDSVLNWRRIATRKRSNSFVRIGKSLPHYFPELQTVKRANPTFGRRRRPSEFVRIGKKSSPPKRRTSMYVRIGKKSAPVFEVPWKHSSTFVRIGRSVDQPGLGYGPVRRKRSLDNLREPDDEGMLAASANGDAKQKDVYANTPESKRATNAFVRIGKSQTFQKEGTSVPQNKRTVSSFLRIGRNLNSAEEKRDNAFVRIGRAPGSPGQQLAQAKLLLRSALDAHRINAHGEQPCLGPLCSNLQARSQLSNPKELLQESGGNVPRDKSNTGFNEREIEENKN